MNSIRDAPKILTRLNAPLAYTPGLSKKKTISISLHTILIKYKL